MIGTGTHESLGRSVHRPLFPAAHESAAQTVVQVRRYRTDPDPLERHRVPFPGIGADPLTHSLHQSLHLMLSAQRLIFSRRGYLASYLAANAQESQRPLAGPQVDLGTGSGLRQGVLD